MAQLIELKLSKQWLTISLRPNMKNRSPEDNCWESYEQLKRESLSSKWNSIYNVSEDCIVLSIKETNYKYRDWVCSDWNDLVAWWVPKKERQGKKENFKHDVPVGKIFEAELNIIIILFLM